MFTIFFCVYLSQLGISPVEAGDVWVGSTFSVFLGFLTGFLTACTGVVSIGVSICVSDEGDTRGSTESGVNIGVVSDWRELISQSGSCSDAGVMFDRGSSAHTRVVLGTESGSIATGISVVVGLLLIQSGIPSSESVVVGVGAIAVGSGVLTSNNGDIELIDCSIGVDSIFGISFAMLDGALSQSGTVSVLTGAADTGWVFTIIGVTVVSGSTTGGVVVTVGRVGA